MHQREVLPHNLRVRLSAHPHASVWHFPEDRLNGPVEHGPAYGTSAYQGAIDIEKQQPT
jgi:hypothetical protein